MMFKRKKWLILVLCFVAAGVVLLSTMNEKTVEVEKSWALSEAQAANIAVKGLSQDMDIYVQQSVDGENEVTIEGSMPQSFADKTAEIVPGNDELSLSFVSDFGFSLAKFNSSKLKMTILLSDEDSLKNLIVQSNRGNVVLHVPDSFKRNYQLLTNSGKVTEPKQNYDVTEMVKIELGSGDIAIVEESV